VSDLSDGLWPKTRIALTGKDLNELEAASFLVLQEAREMKRRGESVNNETVMRSSINILNLETGCMLAYYLEQHHKQELSSPDIGYTDLRVV